MSRAARPGDAPLPRGLLSVEDDLAQQAALLGYASIAAVMADRDALPPARWGDPIRVGERVHLTLGYLTAMHPAGRIFMQATPITSGVEGVTGGKVIALGEAPAFLATVEWDDGYVQQLHVGSLIQSTLLQNEAIRWHAGQGGDAI